MNKLRGGSSSPMTELKSLAQSSRSVRDELWSWNREVIAAGVIRERIKSRFGIALKRDNQISDFWAWLSQLIEEEKLLVEMGRAEFRTGVILWSRRKRTRWLLTGKVSKSGREEYLASRRAERLFNQNWRINSKGKIRARMNSKLRAS